MEFHEPAAGAADALLNFHGHPVWWLMTAAVVAWYSTVTIYVSIRGVSDIRGMLQRLSEKQKP